MVAPPVAAACTVTSRSLGCAPPSSATSSARLRQPPGGSAVSMAQTVLRLAVATGAAASCSDDGPRVPVTESGKVNSLSLSRLGRLSDVKLGFSLPQYSQGPLHGEDG